MLDVLFQPLQVELLHVKGLCVRYDELEVLWSYLACEHDLYLPQNVDKSLVLVNKFGSAERSGHLLNCDKTLSFFVDCGELLVEELVLESFVPRTFFVKQRFIVVEDYGQKEVHEQVEAAHDVDAEEDNRVVGLLVVRKRY